MAWAKEHKGVISLIALILAAIILIFLPVRVPYKITTTCKTVPVKEWRILRAQEGGLTISLHDNRNGGFELISYPASSGTAAGQIFRFSTNPQIRMGQFVKSGDTIGVIETGFASSGNNENEKQLSLPIISPISGVVTGQFTDSAFLSIGDVSEYLVLIPVRLKDMNYVSPGQDIEIENPGPRTKLNGKILRTGESFQILNGTEYAIALGVVNGFPEGAPAGHVAECSIECQPVPIREYITRSLEWKVNE